MEEIDIIELLKRIKEGKAPKEIEIGGSVYKFRDTIYNINELYSDGTFLWFIKGITLNTKIKILDKPIIEELKEIDDGYITRSPDNFEIMAKLNEVIRKINEENKDE